MATMFGAINRFISRLDSENPSQSSRTGQTESGFQVLRNKNQDIAIEPWYDFIVGINGRQIDDSDPSLFATEIRNCAGASVTLSLWNAKGSRLRTLSIPVPTPSPTLGLTLQYTPLSTTEDIWHILDVIPYSPADNAGLLPYSDYIVGTPEGAVHGEAGLGELVEDYLSRSLRLYVYNHEYGVTRLVTITPSRTWGGTGALGCVLGFGALHRLPAPLTEPPDGPGETLFETARFSNEVVREGSPYRDLGAGTPKPVGDFLVPAALDLPPVGPPKSTTSPVAGRSGRKPKIARGNSAFEDMFKEGEAKSKEEDFAPSKKGSIAPPPPRVGPPTSQSPAPVESVEPVNTPEPEAGVPGQSEG